MTIILVISAICFVGLAFSAGLAFTRGEVNGALPGAAAPTTGRQAKTPPPDTRSPDSVAQQGKEAAGPHSGRWQS
ncbi:MAG TPA: hypothetical protein VHD15_06845 [Hyphomicrobiales bacterium]|nr:hypothetical protein [Hyphomicrobiales bacterium]